MPSHLAWWSKEKIEYYSRASKYSSFHKELSFLIKNEISKNDSILELGSGLGYVTEILDRDGYNIHAIENDSLAVKEANKRAGKELLVYSDAYSIDKKADVLLLIFFGRLKTKEDLSYFLSLANKKIIYIISRHKANPYSERKDRRDEVIGLLEKEKMEYRLLDISIDFSQPLRDLDDAALFFKTNYNSPKIPRLESSDNKDYPLLFRNKKEMSVFIINKDKK